MAGAFFWAPTESGVRRLTPSGVTPRRLRGKSEVLFASPAFAWVLFGRRNFGGGEGEWTPAREPRWLFRKLIERTMPGYFDVLGARYSVDNLLAEYQQHLDLAFLAANWRYSAVIGLKYYSVGLAEWPPVGDWWTARLRAMAGTEGAGDAAPSQGAPPAICPGVATASHACAGVAAPSQGGAAPSHGGAAAGHLRRGSDLQIGLSPAAVREPGPKGAPGTSCARGHGTRERGSVRWGRKCAPRMGRES